MGRKKINIKKIENERQKAVTFSRRRAGLFKKANELSILCDCRSLVMFSSHNPNEMMEKYMKQDYKKLHCKTPLTLAEGGNEDKPHSRQDTRDFEEDYEDEETEKSSCEQPSPKFQFILPSLKTAEGPMFKDSLISPVSIEDDFLVLPQHEQTWGVEPLDFKADCFLPEYY